MKAKKLAAAAMMSMILLIMTMGVDGMMAGPPDDTHVGPGMNGNEKPGPRWEQQTENRQVEKGLMFRWGKETPETSIESEATGDDIGIRMAGLRFRNNTMDLNVDIEEEDWEVTVTTPTESVPDNIKIRYQTTVSWKNPDGATKHTSDAEITYHYSRGEERTIDYRVQITDSPGNGNLTFSIAVENIEAMEGCCWKKESSDQHKYHNTFLMTSEKGDRLSQFDVKDQGIVLVDDEYLDLDITTSDQLVNTTASLDVGMSLPADANYASIEGSLSILDGLVDSFIEGAEEATEFVIDHLYFFAGGAVVMTIIIIAGISITSRKKIDTNGKDLDLKSNRYFKGPQ